nr:reverse transcriptase domain-containing protein [Tanacetum cinerariifolium]
MHKAFPLPVIKFPLAEEERCHCHEDSTAGKSQGITICKDLIPQSLCCFTRIQQYLQHEHYALWEVIEFGDSYEVPASTASTTTTDTTIGETGKKSGRTVTLTAEDMQKRKNDVKARTTLLGNEATKKTKNNLLKQEYGNFKAEGSEALEQMFNILQVIVGQLQFMDVEVKQDDLNQKGYEDGNSASVSTASTNVPTVSANIRVASISQDTACAYIASQSCSQIKFKDINQIDEDDMEEMDIKWSMALLSMKAKIEEGETTTDKEDHALVAVEEAPIDFSLMANTSPESKELETLKKEKEGVDSKLACFLTASKDIDNLIESQRSDKNKEGLGHSVVPPPPAQIYSSPKKDLSWTGHLEFADDTVTDYSRPSLTMESTSGDDQNRNSSVPKTDASPSTITSKPFIKFVKPNDSPSKSKKPPVKYAEQYRKPNKKPNVRGNQRNWNNLKSHQLGPNFVMKKKACFNSGDFNHLAYDVEKCSQNNIDDKGYWDSGCTRHIISNISYLSDYEPFDGGYVSFSQRGCKITGKGTIKTVLQKEDGIFLSQDKRLISWQCKKHTIVATSTTEAEYIAAASGCGQVLWIQNQLLDYGVSVPCETFSREISSSILCFNTIMARLQFYDYHNMVTILEKSKHNVDFHPMVDFVEASLLRIETMEEGTKILVTVDDILRTVTESSLRRNLKLQDVEGISSLPDTKLFENLTLMGYNISPNQKFTFQKGQFSHQWKYLIHTIMQCLSPKSIGFNEFISNIATVLVCLATNRTYNFSKMIFDGLVKNVNNKEEATRLKRKGLSLEQESAKKFKPSDEVPKEVKSPDEVPEENVKEMMQSVPIEEVYVEALQVKHPIINWKMANDLILKIYKIANSPRQQEEVPTASEESSHCQKKRDATAMRIALLVMHTYYAKELPIPPPVIMPPSPMLSPMFNPHEFFLPKELLPRKKCRHDRSSSSTPTLPQEFKIGESSRKTSLEHHEEQIEEILNHLDELSLDFIENMEDNIEDLKKGRVIIQQDLDNIKTELQETRAQVAKLQRKQLGQNNKIALARFKINDLEQIIKEIQARHQADKESLLSAISSAAPAMTQAAIRQLVVDSVTAALEAQTANIGNADNTNRNHEPREAHIARKCSYKEFISCQPFNFKGSEGAVGLICLFERTELVFSHSNCIED